MKDLLMARLLVWPVGLRHLPKDSNCVCIERRSIRSPFFFWSISEYEANSNLWLRGHVVQRMDIN